MPRLRLRTLELRNYRRFRHAVLEFPDGLIAITGPNGAGKSTLLEALAWCLFGHDAARTGKDLLRHADAAAGDDVEVRLEFDLDGAAWRATRRLRGKTQQPEAEVVADGALVVAPGANSGEAATRHLARVLGMDRRGFHATVVAHQGDLNALDRATPQERKRLVAGLLGVDEVEQAIALARAEKREAAIRLDEVRRRLAQEEELRARLARLESDLQGVTTAHDDAAARARREAEQAGRAEREAASLRERRDRHRELRGRLEALQRALAARDEQCTRVVGELQLLEDRRRDLERLQAEGKRFTGLDERLRAAEARRQRREARRALERERDRLDLERRRWQALLESPGPNGHDPEAVRRDLVDARTRLESVTAGLGRATAELSHLESERARLGREADEAATKHRTLEALGPEAPCPVCERALGDALDRIAARGAEEEARLRARRDALGRQGESLRTGLAALMRTQEEARAEASRRDRVLHEIRTHREEARLATAELGSLATQLEAVTRDLDATGPATETPNDSGVLEREREARDRWRQAVARLDAETAREPRLRTELATLAAHRDELRAEIEATTRQFAEVPYEEGAWEAAEQRAREQRGRLHTTERTRDVLAERLQGLGAQREQARAEVGRIEEARGDAAELERRVRIGETIAADRGDVGVLPEFKNHLIGRIRPALAHATSALVAEMTQGRYTDVAIDDDYTLEVFDGARRWPLERYSGGERDVVQLGLRLAVSELVAEARRSRRLRFVALDEVLAGQDEARRGLVLGALKALGSHFAQVLLVTHLDEVRDRVDHVVRVMPLPDGTSRLAASWTEKV